MPTGYLILAGKQLNWGILNLINSLLNLFQYCCRRRLFKLSHLFLKTLVCRNSSPNFTKKVASPPPNLTKGYCLLFLSFSVSPNIDPAQELYNLLALGRLCNKKNSLVTYVTNTASGKICIWRHGDFPISKIQLIFCKYIFFKKTMVVNFLFLSDKTRQVKMLCNVELLFLRSEISCVAL